MSLIKPLLHATRRTEIERHFSIVSFGAGRRDPERDLRLAQI